jgi:hypothetical protein
MGSVIEINDTLRITKAQGFPAALEIERHLETPYSPGKVVGQTFSFQGKSGIRVYKAPPVRNFLVEALGDKWLYWGLCHLLQVKHDYELSETSGIYKITHLNSPAQMKQAFELVDRVWPNSYFDHDES